MSQWLKLAPGTVNPTKVRDTPGIVRPERCHTGNAHHRPHSFAVSLASQMHSMTPAQLINNSAAKPEGRCRHRICSRTQMRIASARLCTPIFL